MYISSLLLTTVKWLELHKNIALCFIAPIVFTEAISGNFLGVFYHMRNFSPYLKYASCILHLLLLNLVFRLLILSLSAMHTWKPSLNFNIDFLCKQGCFRIFFSCFISRGNIDISSAYMIPGPILFLFTVG